jgi:hypothetical protein
MNTRRAEKTRHFNATIDNSRHRPIEDDTKSTTQFTAPTRQDDRQSINRTGTAVLLAIGVAHVAHRHRRDQLGASLAMC